jgi:hypothetical protein
VEGDDFVTDDIVAGCDVGWQCHIRNLIMHCLKIFSECEYGLLIVLLKHTQVLLVPSNLIAFKPNLTDLEPFCCRGVELIAGGVTTIRQVEHQWSYVMRPLKNPSENLSGHRKHLGGLTPSPPPASHWKVRALPGFVGATRDTAVAFWPQFRKGLLAPLTGSMVLILRTTLGTLD